MGAILTLSSVCLKPEDAPPIRLVLEAGQSCAIMGPAGSGKSTLLSCIQGSMQPAKGSIYQGCETVGASIEEFSRRASIQSIAKQFGGRLHSQTVSDALTVCGLWDLRKEPLSRLTPGEWAAASLLPVLTTDARILCIDGVLDMLDPWRLDVALEALQERVGHQRVLMVATNRADIAAKCDLLIVLSGGARFVGTVDELVRQIGQEELVINTNSRSTASAIVKPFAVQVAETEDGIVLRASDGQQAAADLLLRGYGSVQAVVYRRPTLEQALKTLVD